MRSPEIRHRVEYGLFRLARGALRLLPEQVALGLGSALGSVAGRLLRVRRDVVETNLAHAFPHRDERWRRRVLRASYRHLGREAVATFLLAGSSPSRIRARTEVRGLEAVERARREGRGAILVTGHLGNWEVGGASLAARGIPVDGVAFPQRNPLFDRDLTEARSRLGMRIIPRGRASRAVFDSLEAGRVPGLVADQNGGPRGLFVDFLGRPASTHRGPAVFALRSGAALVAGAALADPGRPGHYRVRLREVEIERTGDVGRDVRALTAAHTAVLEEWVREAPEQYFWVHKRWKTRPPGEDGDDRGAGAGAGGEPQEPAPEGRL